jgi:zinc transport system ATP-binding protein
MAAFIEVDNLSFAYQEFAVLRDVTFRVQEGECVGIIGPNGGGKTTLLKLLMGFLKPTEGTIQFCGRPSIQEYPRIAYVPQVMRFDRLFPITVLEVVLMGLLSQLPWYGRYHQASRQAAIDALDKVGMTGFEERAFGTLSGGQAQRVLIARALVSQPDLLLLDEPTASVDVQAQGEIYTFLQKLRGKMTILMVTHDLNVAINFVDKVICVQHTVMTLKPQEVCEHFAFGLYHSPLITPGKKGAT